MAKAESYLNSSFVESYPREIQEERYMWLMNIQHKTPDHSSPVISQWRPIETAPRDYTYILIYDGKVRIAEWDGECWCAGDAFISYPTHWMPLPPPPQQ